MNAKESVAAIDTSAAKPPPPRERILAAASDLFYHHGIRAVGVDAIAEAAGTNKMTLYRHFDSKDELVAEYLRGLARGASKIWDALAEKYPNDPRKQLHGWLEAMSTHTGDPEMRGCALANAAVELPDKDHPARKVIEESKCYVHDNLSRLCRAAGVRDPDLLADELFVLLEGTQVCAQSFTANGPIFDLVRMGETMIAAHAR
ncbi:MAG: TetR/AcrR family transcriptional regulator [Xanthobacteraceae bacterium]